LGGKNYSYQRNPKNQKEELKNLWLAMRKVLNKAIKLQGDSFSDLGMFLGKKADIRTLPEFIKKKNVRFAKVKLKE